MKTTLGGHGVVGIFNPVILMTRQVVCKPPLQARWVDN